MAQKMPSRRDVFDAIVVGSGATGGWAAKELTEAGLRVCLLEAGRNLDPEKDFTEHMAPYQIKYRGQSPEMTRTRPIQSKCYACMEWNYDWWVNDHDNPYTTASDKPYDWFRLRVVGGRSRVWARQSYRLSDLDFKSASRDGYGMDWPIRYADLAPYYDKVETYIGVSGQAEGKPQLPDGKFLPPMKMTCGELMLKEVAEKKFGRTLTIGRTAMLTRPLNGRAPCHYCGPCERGCRTNSYFNGSITVAAAQATGRLTLLTNSIAHQVLIDPNTGKARGVSYLDRGTRTPREVQAKTVVLCAQAQESTRILFNSATRQHPNGLGNSSGVLGHYLMDHYKHGGATGELPMLRPEPWHGPPRRPNSVHLLRFRNVTERNPKFLRGYGLYGRAGPAYHLGSDKIGKEYKQAVKDGIYNISLDGYAECLPRWDNYCEPDKNVVDAWGIPVLRFHASYGDNERATMADMAVSAAEMLEAVGAVNIRPYRNPSTFGNANHDVGSARMGKDPRTSVLNRWNQVHDVKNVFVADGASFVTSPYQNPTLTLMALTVRACDYLVEQFKKGAL